MSKALAVNATVSGRQRFFDFLYKWGMLLTVVLLIAVFGLASDNFLDPFNIINILRSIPSWKRTRSHRAGHRTRWSKGSRTG